MKRSMHGFSLVEILVAMVIALIGTLIIFQVFEVSESIKRTTTTGGDAQQNGLLALVALERDARMAGFGINYPPLLGCLVEGKQDTRDIAFTLTPVIVNDANPSDSVTFMYGTSNLLLSPPKLVTATAAAADRFKVDNRYGFQQNELVVVGQVGPTLDRKCSLAQVSSLPTATGQKDEVYRDTGDFNKAPLVASYDAWDNTSMSGGRLMSLGAGPVATTYSVDSVNAQLLATNAINGTATSVIAEGIVMLQVQYGKDTSATPDGQIDVWDTTAPVSTDQWSRVIALRMALVARSMLPEKPTVGMTCPDINNPLDATLPLTDPKKKLRWSGGSISLTHLSTAETDWTCYRYRVFETLVPVRNMLWAQP